MIKRIFSEKKSGFDVEAQGLLQDLRENLEQESLTSLRIVVRYDVKGISDEVYQQARHTIFSEPQVDFCYDEEIPGIEGMTAFAVEFLPGQYDQRADFAGQALQLLTQGEKPLVRAAKVYLLGGNISDEQLSVIKNYVINPVEAREASIEKPEDLKEVFAVPEDVAVLDGFTMLDRAGLKEMIASYGLAMDEEDLAFCQAYFRDTENRCPTLTELRMIDTYWSDHCRHTTFLTELTEVSFDDPVIEEVYRDYLQTRSEIYGDRKKSICFMDIATIGTKALKKKGLLDKLDESEEINACSIKAKIKVDGEWQDYIIMFKNETHNHPTEIEPYGGAATCLGGAIRDPLSGRSYVYQAMRVTGAGDPRVSIKDTMPGKLPQRKLTRTAAHGYSSYGNQIGLATGYVHEIYDEGYIAKRMEIGAVVGAAPAENIVRERPQKDDIIILLGGRTGRDGCGGATGSSKAHTEDSLLSCGAEVQKGNPPEERKLQRLFRNPEATRLIKRCNDFGAGGVSVAIGELADGLEINLDAVPKKYEGLDGTELAISESQERMAVVVAAKDADAFIRLAQTENLEATRVAVVTDRNRLVMHWRGKTICDISRDFLNTNGASKQADAKVAAVDTKAYFSGEKVTDWKEAWLERVGSLQVCSQKGLVERFDASIGAASVMMPFGGRTQGTPTQSMVAKIPVMGETDAATIMAYGFEPKLSKISPFHGAVYAIVDSVTKLVAGGADSREAWLTLQEYFERLGEKAERWGKPLAALLGAYLAQKELGIAAIGGKDSMSGSFRDIDVPPTLVSFAIAPTTACATITPEFKRVGSKVVFVPLKRDEKGLPCFEELKETYRLVYEASEKGKILSAYAVVGGGICEAISKMCFGNEIGFSFAETDPSALFCPQHGGLVLELASDCGFGKLLGETISDTVIRFGGEELRLDLVRSAWEKPLEKVFPTKTDGNTSDTVRFSYDKRGKGYTGSSIAKPRVFIPVFPGTNCEYDSARAFEKAGAEVSVLVMKNLTPSDIEESVQAISREIQKAQIVMLAGGFSAGDEPDGSGKFIATTLRNPRISEDIHKLLKERDGLMLGICNGFQALVKLGLLPFGEIRDMDDTCPTLTYNTIGRHVSTMVNTRVASVKSPWFARVNVNDVHTIAVSHGEGRFIASEEMIKTLADNGQIATQYVDACGNPTNNICYNPNGSVCAIEGITSPDGRILGKMGHSERYALNNFKNIVGNKDQHLFRSGVEYFR